MNFKIEINNSWCKFSDNTPKDIIDIIGKTLSYTNDIRYDLIRAFNGLKKAKELNILKLITYYKKLIYDLKQKEHVKLLNNNTFPTGLFNIVRLKLEELKQDFVIEDLRQVPIKDQIFRLQNTLPELRYYQKEAIENALYLERGVIESAVGSGKTLMIIKIVKELSRTTLIVVPSLGLLDQIYEEFELYFGSKIVQKINTDLIRKAKKLKPIRIVTSQTLVSLKKSNDLSTLIEDVKVLYIDEFHHAASDTFTKLLDDFSDIYYRFGGTGTFTRNDNKILDLWGVLSNKIYTYYPYQATKDGFLTPIEVLVHTLPGIFKKSYPREYETNYSFNKSLLLRIEYIIKCHLNSQILILVSLKDKCGKKVHDHLKASHIPNVYVSGDSPKEELNAAIQKFNSKETNILIGSSVLGEGIDIRTTDHLVMVQGGKSEIAIVQAVGRAVRLSPGKLKSFIHDFRFLGTKYLDRHLGQRLDIYKNYFEPIIKIVKD